MKKKDYFAVVTMLCMIVTSLAGILSYHTGKSYDFVNQYGDTVKLYGSGIYAHDTYLQAAISIGTDVSILLVFVPIFLFTYLQYRKKQSQITELKLITVYGTALYYAISISFGLAYNSLFLVYVALVVSSLFGLLMHIKDIQWKSTIQVTKGVAAFLIVSGIALFVAWLPDVITSLVNGTSLSIIGIYTTCITFVLDMGVISPLCLIGLYLMNKKDALGTMIFAVMVKLCIIVGIMMIPQNIFQILFEIDIPLPVLITKSVSFVLLGGFAYYFERKMYRELEG